MKFLDIIILLILFIVLLGGVYFLWTKFPTEPIEFEEYRANISVELPTKSAQFYPNMRFPSSTISYSLSENCSANKIRDFKEAISLLEARTILKFEESTESEINVTCSNISPEPSESGHFVAGEGGPSIILNNSRFAVILSGKIALYRFETCEEPQIALHELLHALGFEHNSNENSIMYPITDCKQSLDVSIIEDINQLYSQQSAADLLIETIKANKTGKYINFEITIINNGLKEIKNSSLVLANNNELIKTFQLGNFEIGSKRQLRVSNLQIPSNTEEISFEIETSEPEISKENNKIRISLTKSADDA